MRGLGSLLLTAFSTIALPSIALAGEDELILAVEPGYGLLSIPDGGLHGAGADASAWLGLTETIWLAASGGVFAGYTGRSPITEVCAGVALAFDVLRTIPYGELMLGAFASGDAIEPSFRFALGADYLISPTLAVGVVARYRPLAEVGDGLLTAQVRLALRIEL